MTVELRFPGMTARIAGPILTLGAMALIGVPAQVLAQAVSPGNTGTGQPATETLQEVVVTGTSISGGNAQAALPVQILSTADIARTGATSVPALLQEVSSHAPLPPATVPDMATT